MNVDVTSPGATLALGMMFFNTENQYELIFIFVISNVDSFFNFCVENGINSCFLLFLNDEYFCI